MKMELVRCSYWIKNNSFSRHTCTNWKIGVRFLTGGTDFLKIRHVEIGSGILPLQVKFSESETITHLHAMSELIMLHLRAIDVFIHRYSALYISTSTVVLAFN